MKIRLHRHPFAPCAPEEFEAESLAVWLLNRYGETPQVDVKVFAGEPSEETEISRDAAAILRGDAPVYVVLESPRGPLLPYIVNLAISMVLSYIATSLFGPKDPLANRSQESPNNQLANRENKVRILERVEDIYGTVRSIPTLLMPTYAKYINHLKVEYGYYCVGRGYYDIDEVRDGDTLLSAISGSSAAIYAPFTSPNSGTAQATIGDAIVDGILTVSRSSSVDGITLKPTNQLQITPNLPYKFYAAGAGDGDLDPPAGDTLWQTTTTRQPNFSAVSEVGQDLTITMAAQSQSRSTLVTVASGNKYVCTSDGFFYGAVIGSSVTVAGVFVDPANAGTMTVSAVSADGRELTVAETLVVEATPVDADFDIMVDYSGTRTIAEVGNGYVVLTGASVFSTAYVPGIGITAPQMTATVEVDNGLVDWSDWHTLPASDRTEVWTNVLAQGGMSKDDGSKSFTEVEYEVQIEQLDDLFAPLTVPVVETITGSISGATSNERAETLEQTTAWTGPARVRMRRTTPFDYDFGGLVTDEIKWVDLYSVAPVDKLHFGNKTTIHTVTQATARATTVKRRELNCLASRKLPTYNGTTFSGTFDSDGALATGTISATSKIVDILAAVTVDPWIGNRAITDIDLAQIWTTQQTLDAWHADVGQFNYTFDDDNLSFEETVKAIADAAFCVPYRQNGQIRLALDRPQSTSTALFTHRNKRPNAETITRKFASDADYDGVELSYQDPDTESQETIRLPLVGDYTKLKKIEISGIRNYNQAWLRANREYYRLKAQRLTIETETTTDARSVLPNARVDIVDNTRFKSWDGEVIAQSGLTLTLSRDVEFLPATPHSIVLMKRDGSLQSIACTEVSGSPNKVLLGSTPAEAIVTEQTADGIRTIFSFAADSARGAMAWLVQELRPRDNYVQIVAINYSDDYYTADEEAIPDKSGVIY